MSKEVGAGGRFDIFLDSGVCVCIYVGRSTYGNGIFSDTIIPSVSVADQHCVMGKGCVRISLFTKSKEEQDNKYWIDSADFNLQTIL